MVTESDRVVLEFLAEQRLGRASQVAELLGVSVDAAARRLRRLDKRGYVKRSTLYAGQSLDARITRRGLGVVGSRLSAPDVADPATYRHDIGLGWVWLAARSGAFGEVAALHSERTMRSEDRRAGAGASAAGAGGAGAAGAGAGAAGAGGAGAAGAGAGGERFGLRAIGAGPRGGTLTHYPDLLVDTIGGHRIAVELELTSKAPARLQKIMRRYVADRRIDAVLYLVDDERVGRHVQAAAARAGASELVHVQRVHWSERTGPPGRGHGRVPALRRAPARRAVELGR